MRKIGTDRALFIAQKLRDEFIYNYAKAEGNTLTFAETQTVINGISVGGKRMFELNQIEHIRDSWDELIRQVKENTFAVEKNNFIYLNSIVAEGENPEVGSFRTRVAQITGTSYMPPLPMLLNENFREMMSEYNQATGHKKGFLLFLYTARNQYFADGNKRTGQLMMNGELMMQGYAPITIAPDKDLKYRDTLLDFYETGNRDSMIDFLYECANAPRYLVMQDGADLSEEALRRANFIPLITGGTRAEVVFRDIAKQDLVTRDVEFVNWKSVEERTIFKAIGELGFSPKDVSAALNEFSPTRITPKEKTDLSEKIQKLAPDLQSQYKSIAKQKNIDKER